MATKVAQRQGGTGFGVSLISKACSKQRWAWGCCCRAVSVMKFQGITRWAQKTTYKWGLLWGPTEQMHGYLRKKKRGIPSSGFLNGARKNIFFDVFQQPKWKQKPKSWPHTRVDTKEIKITALSPRKGRILISHSHEHPSTPNVYILPGHVPFEKNMCFL